MDTVLDQLPNNVDDLKRLVAKQQVMISRHLDKISHKDVYIEKLEEQLRRLQQHRFGQRSEKDPNQIEMQWFNEAELLAAAEPSTVDSDDLITVPVHQRKKAKPRALPADLPRAEVVHDLSEADKTCDCGQTLRPIGEEVTEQLSIIPQQFYVIRHRRLKYACACKGCIRTATMPKVILPGTQASAQWMAYSMVSKLHDGLPLYRQEKMAARVGLDLARAKLARWQIDTAPPLQPLYNLLQDTFFEYDIALSDETGIQVLKEPDRTPQNKSYLWIRRGGPPDKPVVLLDYSSSKSGETAYSLLSEFRGYLVCDAATNFNESIRRNELTPVFCNDHARRKFVEVIKGLSNKNKASGWAAAKAIAYYKKLYRIEQEISALAPAHKWERRQQHAKPIWDEFVHWANEIQREGLAHGASRQAMAYFLKHAHGLRRYCEDGRLPISNIMAEHVAKTISIARKNFLFADTPAGAKATAMIYCLLESAKANGHNTMQYMSIVLTDIPNATTLEDYEALLPWNLTPADVKLRYAELPVP
jgi:transposase